MTYISHAYGGPEVQHRILMKHQIQIANIKFQIRHIKFKFITSNLKIKRDLP